MHGLGVSSGKRKFQPMRYGMLSSVRKMGRSMLILVVVLSNSGLPVREKVSLRYRTIVLFRKSEKSFFVYGFAKSELSNVGEAEEEQFNSNLHSSRHLRRLPCAAPHRTARTASSPLVCLLGVNLNAFWN